MSAFRIVLLVSIAVTVVQCYQSFSSRIPNGNRVLRNGVIWQGVGHLNIGGSGPLNPFGEAFRAANYRWTVSLCQADSDGDGLTNGQELGDPACTWRDGRPSHTGTTTHPGFHN